MSFTTSQVNGSLILARARAFPLFPITTDELVLSRVTGRKKQYVWKRKEQKPGKIFSFARGKTAESRAAETTASRQGTIFYVALRQHATESGAATNLPGMVLRASAVLQY